MSSDRLRDSIELLDDANSLLEVVVELMESKVKGQFCHYQTVIDVAKKMTREAREIVCDEYRGKDLEIRITAGKDISRGDPTYASSSTCRPKPPSSS